MEKWLERVKLTLFPRSVEKSDIRKAISEWHYTGETYDLEEPCETCQLCGHLDIRYQFTIRNRYTGVALLIGSECITRFDIHAVDEFGQVLDSRQTRKTVAKDRQKLITDARERRMIQTLLELKQKEDSFNVDSFITYFKKRGAFTPNQLSLVIWRLKANNVNFNPKDFKLIIKKNREKDQLLKLENWKMVAIQDCLSASQKKFYFDNMPMDRKIAVALITSVQVTEEKI